MDTELSITFISTVAMISGVYLIYLAFRQRSEALDRVHRERMALIERGQVPPPVPLAMRSHAASSRSMSLGIIVVGFGLGLMTLISIAAGTPDVGVGLGGAIMILGGSFIVRSLIVKTGPQSQNSPSLPPEPPAAV
jgi:hypothetical protein